MPPAAGDRVGEQDVGVRGFDLDALERSLEAAVAAGGIDVGQGPGEIAGTTVGQRELLLGGCPVLRFVQFLEPSSAAYCSPWPCSSRWFVMTREPLKGSGTPRS